MVNHMLEINRINRNCLNENSIQILAIYAVGELKKLSANSRQKLRIKAYDALTEICVTPSDLFMFASLCDSIGAKKGELWADGVE